MLPAPSSPRVNEEEEEEEEEATRPESVPYASP
jgi:hypothetical protein